MSPAAKTLCALALIFSSGVAFAQSSPTNPAHPNASLTRAEVRQQIVDIEKAGYDPFTSTSQTYPADLRAAERRLQAERIAASHVSQAHGDVVMHASAAQ